MIRIGTWVRLKKSVKRYEDRRRHVAQVVSRVSGIPGGVQLSGPLDGFRFWNVQDLERVGAPPRGGKRKSEAEGRGQVG